MKIKTYLFKGFSWLLMSCLLSSCNCGYPLPTKPSSPFIYYRNSKGQDLLDPSTAGYFGQNGFTINYLNPDETPGSHSFSTFKLSSGSFPYQPNGYYLSIDPFSIVDDKGNNGIVKGNTCVMFLQISKSISDTLTFDYSGGTLTKFLYNKTLITPPAGMSSYPVGFPVIITK